MRRLALAVLVLIAAGCTESPDQGTAAAALAAPGPPAEPAQYIPPGVRNIAIDCGSSVVVGFEETPRIIRFTSEPNADKEVARAECMAAVDWSPYTYVCRAGACGLAGGCEANIDAESYTELQACRCYSPEEGVWLCQKWALLSPGQTIACNVCNAPRR